jgi:threonine/homoserine/homoserine lactone efflux protein
VALLNPKTALFFAAYLPQFLPMSKEPMVQTLVLGFIFILIAATTDCAYALAAGTLKPWLAKSDDGVISVTSWRAVSISDSVYSRHLLPTE